MKNVDVKVVLLGDSGLISLVRGGEKQFGLPVRDEQFQRKPGSHDRGCLYGQKLRLQQRKLQIPGKVK
jgi:hypothetical protein